MDVTCQRCKAEYEFDETLLGEKGTTVKCSSCGHVFRVLPPEHDPVRSQLRLRYAKGGAIQPLASLRELQQRIRAGEVSLDDELGRDGFPFRKLRELPELKNFFARSPEKTTVKPEPATTAPTLSALSNPDLTPSVPVRVDALRGVAPTAPPPALRPSDAVEPTAATEMLDAPTVVAPIPEEIRPRPARGEAKRTMLGVGPAVAEPARTANPAATLGPAAAMARGRGEPAAALKPASEPQAPPAKMSPAGTLVGAPAARAFANPTEARPRPRNEPPLAHRPNEPQPARYEAPPRSEPLIAPPVPPVPPAPYEPPVARAQAPQVPASLPAPAAPPAGRSRAPEAASPVRLYLDDNELPPERATASSSKVWLLPLVAVLAAGGYFGFNAWKDAQEAQATAVAPEARPADAAVANETASPDAGLAALAEPPQAAAPEMAGGAQADAPSDDSEADTKGAPGKAEPTKAPSEAAKTPAEPREASESKEHKTHEERAHRSAAQAEPKDYGEWVSRGDQLVAKGDHEGAAKAYEAAIALRPTGSEANSGLGFTLLSRGRAREALPHLDRAASSGYAEANIGLGDAYRKLGQPSSALEAYRTYLERLPSGARASYAKSWIGKLEKGESEPSAGPAPSSPPVDTSYRPAGELVEPAPPSSPASENAQ